MVEQIGCGSDGAGGLGWKMRSTPAAAWPTIGCPGCRAQMGIKKVTTDGSGTTTGTVVYICEICRTEAKRPYQGPRLTARQL